ncbi:MAG: exo-beta-N-acetylmuramidase NamZ domain-containing protein [Paludibacteraceae bacterium]
MKKSLLSFMAFLLIALSAHAAEVQVGAEQTAEYLPFLTGKRVALLSNHTGIAGDKHTLDLLIEKGVNVTALFGPEHGFRGTAGAGDHVSDAVDEKTGIPILSLYNGRSNRPSNEAMDQFDILIVDLQDVGLRYYTYYITMYRMMDACTDEGKTVIVFDRPNPNGYYVDGPVLDMKYKSGVGYLPIPVVHGMTMGELALMINGERWLPDGKQCALRVISCKNYTHQTHYRLPVPPSPNLQTMLSIYLYPSTCYFEGTPVSLGRGTDKPFLCYGHPDYKGSNYSFTPHSMPSAPKPPQQDKICYGVDLSNMTESEAMQKHLDLSWLIDAYRNLNIGEAFFTPFFEKLIGVTYVREMILQGKSAEEIRACWTDDVEHFKQQRKPYLLYAE